LAKCSQKTDPGQDWRCELGTSGVTRSLSDNFEKRLDRRRQSELKRSCGQNDYACAFDERHEVDKAAAVKIMTIKYETRQSPLARNSIGIPGAALRDLTT